MKRLDAVNIIAFSFRELSQICDGVAAATALERFREAVPGSYLEGVAQCLVGLAKEQQGDVSDGAAMVEQSHPLILQVDLSGTPYPALCWVPALISSPP